MPRVSKDVAKYPLRVQRISHGLTLKEVAVIAGVGERTMSRIEQGEAIPSRTTARRLYKYFNGDVPMLAIYDPAFHQEVNIDVRA